MSSIRQIRNRYALEFSRSATSRFLSAMHSIAEHFGYHFLSAKEMDLEPVRLFRGAGFCVNAFDVRFGIRVGSFSHENVVVRQTLSKSGAEANANRRLYECGKMGNSHAFSLSS